MSAPEVFFLPAHYGSRLCVYHRDQTGAPAPACILHVHAFAEEMNKCRRNAALTARKLATQGCAVLQIDLYGCGDSAGDSADARWEIWLNDLQTALDWIQQRHRGAVHLWGERLGALLAMKFVADRPDQKFELLLLSQPIVEGKSYLATLNRLQLARKILAVPVAHGRTESAQKNDSANISVAAETEFSGYTISAEFIQTLNTQFARDWCLHAHRIHWLEMSTVAGAPQLSAQRQFVVDLWRESGNSVQLHAVDGPAYWQSQELIECDAWVNACCRIFQRGNNGDN